MNRAGVEFLQSIDVVRGCMNQFADQANGTATKPVDEQCELFDITHDPVTGAVTGRVVCKFPSST